ncbi:MAG: MMPL family transporter, partial [Desulfobulbaceae bacterium]|nr:MMPL family transporter [Desulfobulbaceae bacterium]
MNRSPLVYWGIALFLLLVGGAMAWQVKISDDALDLLPGEAVRGDLKLLTQLGLVDRVFLTLSVDPVDYPSEAEAQAALKESTRKVGEALAQNALFSEVVYRFPTGYEGALFQQIQSHLPALLSPQDLAELGESFTAKGLDDILHKDFVLLNSPAGIGLKKQIQRDPLGLTPRVLKKLSHLKNEFAINVADGFFLSRDGHNTMLMAQSIGGLTNSKYAREVQAGLVAELDANLEPGVQWRVIGSLPHTLTNANSVQHDLKVLLPIASILLLILLMITLRDLRALLVLGIPFMAAPVAIAIMGTVYGRVSALALGFGIVLLGIAVDFAVHLYLALSREQGTNKEILKRLIRPV